MAKKTNPKLIGGFVVGAIVLAIVGILAFGGTQYFVQKQTAVLFFEGSLSGLDVGSPVTFRGVKVGTVTDVAIQYDVNKATLHIPVHIQIEPDKFQLISGERNVKNILTLIKRGLRGQLVSVSMVTGQTAINFDLFPGAPLTLTGLEPGQLELPTMPSSLDLLKANVSEVLVKISRLPLEQISSGLLDTIQSANDLLKHSNGLIDHSVNLVDDLDAQVKPLSANVTGVTDQATATLKEAQARLQLRPGEPAQNLNDTLLDARRLLNEVDRGLPPLFDAGRQALKAALVALDQVNATLAAAQVAIEPSSPIYYEISGTLRELKSAATAIRVFAEYIQRNPSALLTGKR